MPIRILEFGQVFQQNQEDGGIQDRLYSFVGRGQVGQEHEFLVSQTRMMEFHLACFEQLFASFSDLDEDFARKLQDFLDAYQTLARLGPEIFQRIQDLNLHQ